LAPIGIASLLIKAIVSVEDIEESFKKIGLFTGICTAVLLIYGILILSILVFLLTRKNPFMFYIHFFESIILACKILLLIYNLKLISLILILSC
jgi:hypothetical protein